MAPAGAQHSGLPPSRTQDLGRRGGTGPAPTLGPTPAGRQGSGAQLLPLTLQGAHTAQLTLLGLCSWVGSIRRLTVELRLAGQQAHRMQGAEPQRQDACGGRGTALTLPPLPGPRPARARSTHPGPCHVSKSARSPPVPPAPRRAGAHLVPRSHPIELSSPKGRLREPSLKEAGSHRVTEPVRTEPRFKAGSIQQGGPRPPGTQEGGPKGLGPDKAPASRATSTRGHLCG